MSTLLCAYSAFELLFIKGNTFCTFHSNSIQVCEGLCLLRCHKAINVKHTCRESCIVGSITVTFKGLYRKCSDMERAAEPLLAAVKHGGNNPFTF